MNEHETNVFISLPHCANMLYGLHYEHVIVVCPEAAKGKSNQYQYYMKAIPPTTNGCWPPYLFWTQFV